MGIGKSLPNRAVKTSSYKAKMWPESEAKSKKGQLWTVWYKEGVQIEKKLVVNEMSEGKSHKVLTQSKTGDNILFYCKWQ